ncbi:MAG: VWA domain-containing protein [SAR202 cluster bacterium]|nr:VWA domain-containing protein [SAR202 cluster bacterium]
MEESGLNNIDRIRGELQKFPPVALEDFNAALSVLAVTMRKDQMDTWAECGLAIAQQSVRSWEAACQYFRASPRIFGQMPFNYFMKWVESGTALSQESPTLAACYFTSSPSTLSKLRPRYVENWAAMGKSLYKGTWKSSTLACKFFQSGSVLVEALTVPELDKFVGFLDVLANRSYDAAVDCLALSEKVFPLLATAGDTKGALISLSTALSDVSWRQVKGLYEALAKALPAVQPDQRKRYLAIADSLNKAGNMNVPAAMLDVSQALSQVPEEHHERLLELSEALLREAPAAMPDFIKSTPAAMERVTINQLEKWFEEGVRLMHENPDGGLAFFRLESSRSQASLEALSASIEFTRIQDLMELYCRALAGAEVKLAASEELAEKKIGWVSSEAPTTEGTTVYVPNLVDKYATKQENFALFKVVSTHQVAHLEFGSFDFQYERPSTLFQDMRPELGGREPAVSSGQLAVSKKEQPKAEGESTAAKLQKAMEAVTDNGSDDSAERGWLTDMQRYFDLFDERKLALDIFTVVEDSRLDSRVKAEYAGIKRAYISVQRDSLSGRPEIKSLPMKEAMMEMLVRLSLEHQGEIPVPAEYVAQARQIAAIARQVTDARANVEDTAEATLRIYAILADVPNEKIDEDEWADFDPSDEGDDDEQEQSFEEMLQNLLNGMGGESQNKGAEEQEYQPSEDVDYRGDFKPEMVQLLSQLRMQKGQSGEGESQEITQEQLEELLKNSAELDMEGDGADLQKVSAEMTDNLMKQAGTATPNNPEGGQVPHAHVDEDGGALDADEPQTFVYDEWDFRANDYKPRWCIVRQKPMAEGDPAYYGTTLHSYGALVDQIRRQFELMVPEMFRKVRRLEDGEEIDIDDVIEAMVDIRTGSSPSDKLFWRRNKVQRDVAVVFLLDTSASTAEAIDETRKGSDDWDAPSDPVEYMAWLRNRRGDGMKRSYKRIIDLEKEACVLLTHALEAIGDVYGIYAFSGYGRENVEFYTIKDINETFGEKVKKRIDKIAPLHATRMGPAIRHAASKLEHSTAKTKLLFLISDGRPQDRGYSREGVEKEYAVHDTKAALDEARAQGVMSFCLTVDKNGHDYLKTMMDDMGYEVLDDIFTLPRRLLYLYERLTM